MIWYVLSFVFSFIVAICITPFVKTLAFRFHLVDDPRVRFQPAPTHSGVVARAGGLAIYCAIILSLLLFVPMSKVLIGIIIGATLIMIVGLLDDYFDLSPYVRLLLNVVVAGITIIFGLGIPYISNPFGGVIHLDTLRLTIHFLGSHSYLIYANIISIIWIVAMMNFINWSKGVDGQLPGFVAISCFFVGLFALRFSGHDISSYNVAQISFITSGAFFGFLFWNMYPQRIMPGYSGGALAGFMLAILSILSFSKFGILMMVLSMPLIDALYVVIRRVISGKSPFKGDGGHFHHRLLRVGWGKRRIATFYWTISFIFGVCALYFQGQQKVLAFFSATILVFVFIFILERIHADSKKS